MSTAHDAQATSTRSTDQEPEIVRLVAVFEPFTGIEHLVPEEDYYPVSELEPCIVCGELVEVRNLATATPPHVCLDCMDVEAARAGRNPIPARWIA